MQQIGDFILRETFKILDVSSNAIKIFSKDMTKIADNLIFFILLIYEQASLKSLRYEIK